MSETSSQPEFDAVARDYDAQLNQGLQLTGESKEYFASSRIAFVRSLLRDQWQPGARVLDYGCGTGTAAPYIREILQPAAQVGCDLSLDSINEARRLHSGSGAAFCDLTQVSSQQRFDLVYCNGVFHHIAPAERPGAMRQVAALLRPGGWFALWENNPWNPMTRLIMSRVPFDRDAILLTPPETRRLLHEAGFRIVCTRYLFIFPSALRALRFIEPWFSALPAGGQYLVLARRPLRSVLQEDGVPRSRMNTVPSS
jgi:SAM-dependent methyltransferase